MTFIRHLATIAVWVILVTIGGIAVGSALGVLSLHHIETSSMEPGIPQSSLALALPTPADRLAVGDVVVIDDERRGTFAHRVHTIEPDGALRLKGDANDATDPETYRPAGAPRIVGHVPLVGAPVEFVLTPPIRYVAMLVFFVGLLIYARPARRRPRETEPEQVGAPADA
ncbi:MAG: S24/S26 family peptidase [Nocardioides sp.]|nr:S24/S26 family peptidase [Nocardioides sp.]